MTPEHIEPIEMAPDKLEAHYRQQLSAMMDGALAPDQARFLLRRLQHDRELGDCWERWQLCGEVLRGRANVLLPQDFAQRVATAIASGGAPATAVHSLRAMPRWSRWGGATALAASVALLALFVARQDPELPGRQPVPAGIVTTSTPPTTTPSAPVPASTIPDSATSAAGTPAAVAVAEVPRPSSYRRSRAQRARAAGLAQQSVIQPAVISVADGGAEASAASGMADPFATQAPIPARPWPRAVLPTTATGAFNTDYGNAGASPSYHPFEPRLPSTQGGDGDAIP